ncbi:UDP:flavonoid glycosyltransferase YjiC (YdhE family) [Micromonospora pisi]|uniref:UDP:flavonoid glycosyltransferase YjiC (YdhE family) n=1 Tax=Micromonospora pisi TaxID=589240 RepID=A0A495JW96_9ACTN|nr:glycosyltransferase [Micromonospora pisi]RKR92429.1 UDP:flavonoid glycosyltransferase YjiC (YdhE family) [Micromonospora pisi]
MSMRILFSTTPAFGHFLPLLPLARAFRRQGHDVAVVTAAGMAPFVEAEGFELLPAGPMPDALFAEVARRTGADPAYAPTPEGVAEFFAGVRVDLSADDAVIKAKSWQPHLIVTEACDFVGPLLATTLDVPHATLAFGPAIPAEFMTAMTMLVRSRYEERGLTPPDQSPSGRWLLDTCPPGLQFEGASPPPGVTRLPLRPEPHRSEQTPITDPSGGAAVPPAGERPRVLVTFGTVFADPGVVAPLLRSLSALDIEIVATLGFDGKPEEYALDSERVRLVPFLPLAQLLENVSAIVGHGGAGTTLGGLARGIPMVVVPQGADQFVQADRVVAAGAGLALHPGQNGPDAVAAALQRVLTEPEFAAAARRIGDETSAMPSPDQIAEQLVAALA